MRPPVELLGEVPGWEPVRQYHFGADPLGSESLTVRSERHGGLAEWTLGWRISVPDIQL